MVYSIRTEFIRTINLFIFLNDSNLIPCIEIDNLVTTIFDRLQLTQLSENNFNFNFVECDDSSMKLNFMLGGFYIEKRKIKVRKKQRNRRLVAILIKKVGS